MATGTISTYNLTTGVKLNVEDMIWLTSPFDVPLLGTNGADGRTTLSSDTCFEKKVEWLDETLLTPRSTAGASVTTTTAYVTVATGDQSKFMTTDVLLWDQELLRVTGYGTTSDTLLVTRAFAGTTATGHATTNAASLPNPIVGVGAAGPEGADPQSPRSIDRNDRYNLTQIFGPLEVQISGSENAVAKYGLSGTEFDHQVANRTKEMFVGIEQAILYGQRYEDTGNFWRTMGGLFYYITTNVDSTTTTFSETALLTQMQAVYDAGGAIDRLVVPSRQKRLFSQDLQSQIRYAQDTNVRGQSVDYFDSDFGRVSIVLDRWLRPSDVVGFSRDQCEIDTLRPVQFEMLAKTGDSIKGEIVGEKTMKVRRQQWAFVFNALQ